MKTIVIKLGTSSLCNEDTKELRLANMAQIVEMVVALRRKRHRVCLVSSGGVAIGLRRLQMSGRPKVPNKVQAVASVGQARLIGFWDDLFRQYDIPVAQILLTRSDIRDKAQYKNASNTIQECLNMGAVPIINENDSLSTYEIRFGDNDTLSALTAAMITADYLFLLTDVDCLYTANPRIDSGARPVKRVADASSIKRDPSMSQGSGVGTGGMTTKLVAASMATFSGIATFICRSSWTNSVIHIVEDMEQGIDPENSTHLYTMFEAKHRVHHMNRSVWLLHGISANGAIYIDQGARQALMGRNNSNLLPSGITKIVGNFQASECVEIFVQDSDEQPIGKGIVNYSAHELERIKGKHSHDIERILGYCDSEYVAFRNNLAYFEH